MGKFKEFLINEEVGLADLGTRIDKLFNSPDLEARLNGAFVNSNPRGDGASPHLGFMGSPTDATQTDLTVPTIERTGRIVALMGKKNPIFVKLSDGTEAHFGYDEYKRIQGEPAIGKVMTIMFQRHPNDWTQTASKIDKAIVRD